MAVRRGPAGAGQRPQGRDPKERARGAARRGARPWGEHDWTPDREDLDAVRAAFRRLGPDDREVLALVSWEGLGSAEIATVLGCSRGAARLRLHRARKRLAGELSSAGVDVARVWRGCRRWREGRRDDLRPR
ncbi:RNA polymerase sigma factor [Microbispora rosea]|uniref:RNA polymerase sigma factor n=1 Tax=Microbispora rosea TaxID=58117 RepID=UPI0037A1B392